MNYVKFTIKEKGDVKTSAKGTKFARATVENDKGTEYSNVTLFSPFCDKDLGEVLEGRLESNDYNGVTGWRFVANAPRRAVKPDITKAMETKAANIEKAQEHRADSVKTASTFRDATLLTIERIKRLESINEGQIMHADNIKAEWVHWRQWLLDNWDSDAQPPF